jgi:hypothetical protein
MTIRSHSNGYVKSEVSAAQALMRSRRVRIGATHPHRDCSAGCVATGCARSNDALWFRGQRFRGFFGPMDKTLSTKLIYSNRGLSPGRHGKLKIGKSDV